MCEVVREDEGLGHALDDEQPVFWIVLSVGEKDLGSDAGTDGSDEVENVVLPGRVRSGEGRIGEREETWVEIRGSVLLEGTSMISCRGS